MFLIINQLAYSIHPKTHYLLIPAQGVDPVCQGVEGCVPRKPDHTAGHSVTGKMW